MSVWQHSIATRLSHLRIYLGKRDVLYNTCLHLMRYVVNDLEKVEEYNCSKIPREKRGHCLKARHSYVDSAGFPSPWLRPSAVTLNKSLHEWARGRWLVKRQCYSELLGKLQSKLWFWNQINYGNSSLLRQKMCKWTWKPRDWNKSTSRANGKSSVQWICLY